jgi:arsenate reductase (glutaredoxin)
VSAVLYGIPNCDTVKKARAWLDERHIAYRFADFKKEGVSEKQAVDWLKLVGEATLVNRKGTTFRALDDARRALMDGHLGAAPLLSEQPSLIKRPVLEWQGETHVGFKPNDYAKIFKAS